MTKNRINIMEDPMVLECKSATDISDIRRSPEDVPPNNTILGIWKAFGDSTTMHGLGRAINSRNIWLKVMWGVLVIGGACVAGRNVYETIVNYFTYPVTTIVELESRRHMVFPAVTLCNLNPARFSALEDNIQVSLNRSVESNDSAAKQEKVFKVRVNRRYGNDDKAKEAIRYTMSDMLVDCTFDSETCAARLFEPVDNFLYGKCFTFNSGEGEPLTIERPGNRNGLILELDIQQDEYLPFVSTTGVKVMVHPPAEMAFPEDDGITVGPGRATSIGIRKVTITRQPDPWGKCFRKEDAKRASLNMFGNNTRYTTQVCEKTCYQRCVVERCKCCDENYPCNKTALLEITGINLDEDDLEECDEGNRTVLSCLGKVREDHVSGNLFCMGRCFPPCEEVAYKTNYATGSWPGERFERTLISKARAAKKTRDASNPYPDPITSDFVSKNFLRLEIYFENFVEEVVITNPAYDWNKLLSDIGGQMGLWLGFSIMTGVEILELLYGVIRVIVRRIQNSRNVRTIPGNKF